MTAINLKDFEDYNLSLSSKQKEDPEDARLRRFKDKLLFIVTIIAISIVFCVCITFLILRPDSSYSGIALNGIIGLTMALAGYYVRGTSRT